MSDFTFTSGVSSGALPKLEGLITVPTGGYIVGTDVTFSGGGGPATVTVPAGEYYLNTAGDGTRSLLAELEFQLDALATPDVTVSIADDNDNSTGAVTIAVASGTFTWTWSSTTLRDLLGFTTNPSAVTTITGIEQAEYLWLPNVKRARALAPEPTSTSTTNMGARERDFTSTLAPSGKSTRLSYNTRYVDSLDFDYLLGRKVWQMHETTVNESLEKFYADVIGIGSPFYFHPDRANDTLKYKMFVHNARDFKPAPMVPGWYGASSLWSISYEMRKLV